MARLVLAVALTCALMALTFAFNFDLTRHPKALFHDYTRKFNVSFSTDAERQTRFLVFSANVQKINQLNAAAVAQGRNTRFALNKYALLSEEEFAQKMFGVKMPELWIPDESSPFAPLAPKKELDGLPDTYDWRKRSPPVITPVKDQGSCGGCWSFSTTGNLEGQWALAGHPLTSLSEQNLLDCDHECTQGVCDGGCDGGLMQNAFKYIIKNGLESEKAYPFVGYNGNCQYNKGKVAANITGYTFINNTVPQMQAYIFKNGPISIAADATSWQWYYSGVWYFPCGTSLDHAILLVGWGTETDIFGQKMPYWIVKNSWGADWGMDGYILIERGDDQCGLQKYPISALVAPQ